MEKKKIVIIGGGTAGASALALLQVKLGKICDIELIASKEIPTVGVGEATVGYIHLFLELCGLDPDKTCLDDARGSIKYAVHCKDWLRENHSYFTPIGFSAMEYEHFLHFDRSIKEYWESWPGLNLGLNGKAPFLKQEHWGSPLPKIWKEYAYHVDAGLLGEKLLKHGQEMGAKVIDKTVTEIKIIDGDKIDYIITEDGDRVDADFFIDCSGFNRLVPKACGYKPKQFKEIPNDRAWATKIDYVDRETELPYLSCVECQAMEAGWRWQIGLRDRIGTGYVFSTDYISEEDALEEFKNSFEEGRVKDEDCQLIKFNTECYEKQAGTNWITCGLSSGFVEPLESTSIFFMHNTLIAFLSLIKQNKLPQETQMIGINTLVNTGDLFDDIHYFFMWNDEKIEKYNTYAYETFESTVDYIGAHYAFNKNNKSKYWVDWSENKQVYIKHAEKAMNYKQQHLLFSRACYCLLAVGYELGTEVDGWDITNVIMNLKHQTYKLGKLPEERGKLEDITPAEYLQYTRGKLGIMTHRVWLCNMFTRYAYDINDQYEWLNHCDEIDKDTLTASKQYVAQITSS
jgi:tryptophan halogenase